MKVTINDIAKAANVSKSTVSKAMNDDASIPESTKANIRELMRKMNYTPNSMARHLAKQSSSTIGLMINISRQEYYLNPFFYDIIGGVEKIVGTNNYELNISSTNQFEDADSFLTKYVYSKRLAGIIFPASVLSEDIIDALNKLDFPYVVIGLNHDFLNIHSIDINNTLGGELATSHLLDQGYKKIAFIGGSPKDPISYSRQLGYKNVLKKNHSRHLEELILTGDCDESAGFSLTHRLLQQNSDIDALICVNNYVAFGALNAAKELNRYIPKDIGIVTFDNFPLAPYTSPALTSLNINTFELGQMAASALFNKLHNKEASNYVSLISPALIVRESSLLKKGRVSN